MSHFNKNIRVYVIGELDSASSLLSEGKPDAAFRHLENAHILGQESTCFHVLVHLHMAGWAIRQRDGREFFGQMLRIVGAAALTAIGHVPIGNTGGSNISPFKSLPLSDEHKHIISRAKIES